MTNYDRMIFKIMFGLMMRMLFLICQMHNNKASQVRAEFMAFTAPDGALEKWEQATAPVRPEISHG